MRLAEEEKYDWYLTPDDHEYLDWEKFTGDQLMYHIFKRRDSLRAIYEEHAKITKIGKTAILDTHGLRYFTHGWFFEDGKRHRRVQSFIDSIDGNYDLAIIYACNRHDQEIISEKTPVVHPRRVIDASNVIWGAGWRMYVPGFGYMDTSLKRKTTLESLIELNQSY